MIELEMTGTVELDTTISTGNCIVFRQYAIADPGRGSNIQVDTATGCGRIAGKTELISAGDEMR